jgi:5'-3' exonuclease
VLVISSDKDLLQLVGPRVRAMSARDGSPYGPDEVKSKFGVLPDQMRDYLTLVGDASDNIKGAKGIGPKKAADLLEKFGTLAAVYREIATPVDAKQVGIPLAVLASLREFQPLLETTRALVTLRTDVDLPFAEIAAERVPREALTFDTFGDDMDDTTQGDVFAGQPASEPAPAAELPAGPRPVEPQNPVEESSTALAVRDAEVLPAPEAWERGLDPRSMKEARILAKDMYDSRMFSAYGTPQGVLATVMVGRELGLPAMASLRSVHNIEGRHSLSASLMVALVLKSGLAEYFEPVTFSETEATFITKAKRARNPVTLTHTIDMARLAWPKTKADWEKSFLASGWGRNPTDMLVARATSRLARMVYPDLLAGLYTPEELMEIREVAA